MIKKEVKILQWKKKKFRNSKALFRLIQNLKISQKRQNVAHL